MATIKFNDYIIEKSYYETNDKFKGPDENGNLSIEDTFKAEVGVKNGKGFVRIFMDLGNISEKASFEHVPFHLEVVIRGIFEYSLDEEDSEDHEALKHLLCSNAVAILYPYLRTYIQFLTTSTNQFPPYIAPVMNFAKMLEEKDLIDFYSDLN